MSPEPDKLRLSVVTDKPPAKPLRILIVTAEDAVIRALRAAFDPDSTVLLKIMSDTESATSMLAARRIDLVALDYDHASAVKRAAANNNPAWAHALETGFMPAPRSWPDSARSIPRRCGFWFPRR